MTIEPHDENGARGPPSSPSFVDASTPSGVGAAPPEVLSGADNRRLKGLIKGRLFGDAAPPVRIGRFLVMRQLGSGGMGVVYAVYDEELDRRIAVKLLHADAPEPSQSRLLREAQALAKLSHPNVVTVHEVGTFEGQVYIAMEYVRGQTLQEWLAAQARPWREVVERFQAAARGLAAAHAAGLVHRDFKPSNVLVGDDGRVRVVDFGLVQASADDLEGSAASLIQPIVSPLITSLTATGAIMGTPAYMSPEQHQSRPTDARSDQFSLCVALYEALYHQLPFHGSTFVELRQAVLAGQVAEPPRDAKVPLWLRRVLLRGLALDPAARWPSIDALILELSADPEARSRARLRAALLVTAVSLVIAGLVWSVQERSDAAALSAAAERSARAKKEAAESAQQAAQRERDRAFEEAKTQLAATEAAKLQLSQALADAREQRALAEDQRRIAEEQRSAADAQRRIAEEQRREAERQRAEAERQTERTRDEARRARDANRLARALGAARDEPTLMLALLRETESPAHTPGWVPAAVDTLAQPVSEAILREHRGAVHSATFSPDGQSVATAADDGRVLLWSWRSGEILRLGAHDGPISAVHFSPDGQQLLTASADGSAGLWSLRGGPHRRLPHGATVRVAAFSPDGRAVATGAADGLVRLWQREGDAPPLLLSGHQGPIHELTFSPDGALLASAAADGSARIWELSRPGRGRVLGNHRGAVRAVVFAADGRTIATAGQDAIIRIWSARDEPPRQLSGHEDEVIALTFADGGRALISASLDGSARIWPLGGGEPQVLRGHSGRIYRAALAPGGHALVTASQDHSARIWDLARPQDAPRALIGHREELSAAAWSPDGQHLVTTSRDGQARVWPLRSLGDETLVLRGRAPLRCAAFEPDGPQILTCEGDRVVVLWSRARPEAQPTRLNHRASVLYAAFEAQAPGAASDEARAALTVTSDGVVHRWRAGVDEALTSGRGRDARVAALSRDRARLALAAFAEEINLIAPADAAERRLLGHSGVVHALTFSVDGRRLASGASDRSARIWSADDGAAIAELGPHSGRVTALAFSPDGRRLATVSWDKRARIFEINGGASIVLGEHEGPAWAVAFSPDGASVATGADDHKVRVWPADGRGDVILLSGHEGPVRGVAFSADGRELLSVSDDQSARIWSADFDPAALQARLVRASGVCLSARERVALMGESNELAESTAAACAARPAPK